MQQLGGRWVEEKDKSWWYHGLVIGCCMAAMDDQFSSRRPAVVGLQ